MTSAGCSPGSARVSGECPSQSLATMWTWTTPRAPRVGQNAMRLIVERTGDEISLLPALKRGGEGSIHPVLGQPDQVAKVFTQPCNERAAKLQAMIDNPPVVTANAPLLLAWPQDRLLNRYGECVGFVMPYA